MEKSKDLVDLWKQFERVDYAIRNDASAKVVHPYFVKALHGSRPNILWSSRRNREKHKAGSQAVGTIPSGQPAKEIDPSGVPNPSRAHAASTNRSHALANPSNTSLSHTLVRRQKSTIANITQILDELLEDNEEHTHQVETNGSSYQ